MSNSIYAQGGGAYLALQRTNSPVAALPRLFAAERQCRWPDETMSDDYYCDSILSGRVPVRVVAETENVLAFHHVFQSWETHIVVIPKKHVRNLVDVEDPGLFAELFQVVVRIIKEQRFADSKLQGDHERRLLPE